VAAGSASGHTAKRDYRPEAPAFRAGASFVVRRLAGARHIATYRVALHLLYRTWKEGNQSVTLPNRALVADGVSRWRKWDALRELERLGLIAVERRPRKAPRITICHRS
jgi:hypothetical protein